jgi:hypothetical protein
MAVSKDHSKVCTDVETGPPRNNHTMEELPPKPAIEPFAGRLGGNQGLVLDRADPKNAEILKKVPDAAPFMTFKQGFDLRGFSDINLWKFGLAECVGNIY